MYSINDIVIELPEIDLENNMILRISIDNEWTAKDFHVLFREVNVLYKSKFWVYKALLKARDFIASPNNKNISFMQFAHTPLAHTHLKQLNGGLNQLMRKIIIDTSFSLHSLIMMKK